jgi:hypothetical protein
LDGIHDLSQFAQLEQGLTSVENQRGPSIFLQKIPQHVAVIGNLTGQGIIDCELMEVAPKILAGLAIAIAASEIAIGRQCDVEVHGRPALIWPNARRKSHQCDI